MTGQVVGEGILRGRRSELVRRCSQNHLAAHMAALHGKLFDEMYDSSSSSLQVREPFKNYLADFVR